MTVLPQRRGQRTGYGIFRGIEVHGTLPVTSF
jgi:hypothetical protein